MTIGDKNFTEEFLLGQLYGQALEAKSFTVHLKPLVKDGRLDLLARELGRVVQAEQ
ncbi:MAG TPA: hypothetical protein VE571_03160 [Solirubrobacteraceae bacterium]|nr:hypothetical protein [Solirubrobacteraceae bacterium]